MSNPLTGDFEAVLQISGSTINRLLASMHQNAGGKPSLPSFPHTIYLRIGDDRAIEGVRGAVRAQIGVPRIELIHGVSDRFLLEVGVRARYNADPGTTPLAEFIHGTVRAEYRIQNVDPNCHGWANIAGDYIWIRVVRGSVTFTGTAFDDRDTPIVAGPDEETIRSRITRQIAALLATRYEAAPHKVSRRFRPSTMRSLSAAIGGSAVATPAGLTGDPSGNIASLNNLLLEGADFAVGIRLEYLMAQVDPILDDIRSYHEVFKTVVKSLTTLTVYHVAGVTSATAAWEAHGTHALLKIHVKGRAETESVFTDLNFSVDQTLMISFDAGAETLRLSHVSRVVSVTADGVGATKDLTDRVWKKINEVVGKKVEAATASVAPSLAGPKAELAKQLQTFDDQAGAAFHTGVFTPDGVILRGAIGLAPRRAPVIQFTRTAEEDGYSALTSWIPGGRIDYFSWSWSWFTSQAPGAATHDDRFVLRRPRVRRTRWGGIDYGFGETTPLPGLDGWGILCLKLKGVYVDPVSGQWVGFETRKQCVRFGFPIQLAVDGKLFWRTSEPPELSRNVPFPELALMNMATRPRAGGANTLVLFAGERWDPETAAMLRQGVTASRRRDAGLAVVVLMRDGQLGQPSGRRVLAEAEELTRAIGAPVLVNEDVRGGWSAAYAVRGAGPAWRLLSPGGGVTWMHEGRIAAEQLGNVLDRHLLPSPPPTAEVVRPHFETGSRLSAVALHPGFYYVDEMESRCPPPPLSRFEAGAVVTFVQRGSASSEAQLRELAGRYRAPPGDQPYVVVVVDGNAREAAAAQNELGLDFFAAIPDPQGAIAGRFGIRFWPTTLTIDGEGAVTDVEIGHSARRAEPDGCARPER